MSCLSIDGTVGDFSKAVISFWFWVPSSVTDAAFKQWKQVIASEDLNIDLTLAGVVPLLTWGRGSRNSVSNSSGSWSNPISPCFIGIQTGHVGNAAAEDYKESKISIRFQSQNISSQVTLAPVTPPDDVRKCGNFFAMGSQVMIHTYTAPGFEPMKVNEDAWNHIIVSFNVPGPRGQLWVALNDKNYAGQCFYPAGASNMTMWGYGGAPNDIIATFDFPFYHDGRFEGMITTSGGFSMPTDLFGAPFNSRFSSYGRESVMMAELQVFTGVTIDTNDVNNRRAFIDFAKDSEGNPIVDKDGNGILKPVNPKTAEEFLRQRPAILLHGTSKWKIGKNTGSLGVDDKGEEISSGQFRPAGEIKSYKPDPSLGQ